jgi:hypothetical protein
MDPAFTTEQMCAGIKAKQEAKAREKAKEFRIIVLSCQASSVTEEQVAACVALATGH